MKTLTPDRHTSPDAAPERARPAPAPDVRPDEDDLLRLQATAGNAAVTSTFAPGAAGACPCGGPPGSCACGYGTLVGAVQRAPEDEEAEEEVIGQVSGEGPGGEYRVAANTVTLHGSCAADYAGTTFSAQNVAVRRNPNGACTASGTMTSTFLVATTVTLPPVPDGLTECQRANAQRFIDNVLAPHEQDHVTAFETYNGTVDTPFSVTACDETQLRAALQPLHNGIDTPRQAAANAASAALDPFTRTFDMDEGCPAPRAEGGEGTEGTEGAEEEETAYA